MRWNEQTRILVSKTLGIAVLLAGLLLAANVSWGVSVNPSQTPNIQTRIDACELNFATPSYYYLLQLASIVCLPLLDKK